MFPFLLALAASLSLAEPVEPAGRWSAIGGGEGYRVTGTGDPEADTGAEVLIDSRGTAVAGYGGAIAKLDLGRYRGQVVAIDGRIEAISGPGTPAIWVRADVPGRTPAFATSAADPVAAGTREERHLQLYIPRDSTMLVFGAILEGEGQARVSGMRVRTVPKETTADAYTVLSEAFSVVERYAYNVADVDLPALRRQLLGDELRNEHPEEAYPRIAELLKALRDRHSFAMPPARTRSMRAAGTLTSEIVSHLDEGIAYLRVPGFMGTAEANADRFAGELCTAIATMAPAARGWIIDLRQNNGGNMWPMLAGLKPLLGGGSWGAFRYRDGNTTPWLAERLPGCDAGLPEHQPVAVLFGPRTASSGEAVAVAFSGLPNVRSFGARTAGVSTANQGYALPDGGSIQLTTAIDIDRTGREYPSGLEPDVPATSPEEALALARQWLQRQSTRDRVPAGGHRPAMPAHGNHAVP